MDAKRNKRNAGNLVRVQGMVPRWVEAQIMAFARELDPERSKPNVALAFRKIAVQWAEGRKAQ